MPAFLKAPPLYQLGRRTVSKTEPRAHRAGPAQYVSKVANISQTCLDELCDRGAYPFFAGIRRSVWVCRRGILEESGTLFDRCTFCFDLCRVTQTSMWHIVTLRNVTQLVPLLHNMFTCPRCRSQFIGLLRGHVPSPSQKCLKGFLMITVTGDEILLALRTNAPSGCVHNFNTNVTKLTLLHGLHHVEALLIPTMLVMWNVSLTR